MWQPWKIVSFSFIHQLESNIYTNICSSDLAGKIFGIAFENRDCISSRRHFEKLPIKYILTLLGLRLYPLNR